MSFVSLLVVFWFVINSNLNIHFLILNDTSSDIKVCSGLGIGFEYVEEFY